MRVSPSSARIPSLLAGVLAACCLAALDISAAPLNDNFANRIPLTGTNLTIQGANTAATTEAGENIGGGLVFLTASVWYKWTAPTSGVVYFSGITPYPNFILGLGVYAGTALNALTQPLSTPDGGFPVAAGDSLAVQIGSVYYLLGGGGGTGPFTLSVRMALPAPTSPNDAFADRLPIALPEYHFVGSIFGATNDPGESLPGSNSVQTLWWSLTAPDEGILNITLAAGEFAAVLTAYEGTSLNSLVPVQPVSGYRYHVHMGHEYFIQLASAYTTAGNFSLDTRFLSFTNDMFAGRDYVQGTNWTYVGNASFATREPDELPTNWLNTVWMSWTAPFSGRVDLYGIQPPAHDYAVYTGSTLTNLKLVPLANGGSRLRTMPIQEGVQYHFQFTGDSDDFSLALNQLYPFTHATNDNFSNAPSVQGENAYGDPKSFLDASMEPGEPLHLGSVPQKSLWYQWQAPRYGNLNLSLANNFLTNDVVLAVYQGASVDTLTLIGKGTNTLRLPVVAGDNYYVAAAVPDSIIGDIIPAFTLTQASSAEHPVPGNLLANPSFEPSWTNAQNWSTSGGLGGYFGSSGGADGSTWPVIPTAGKLWQDITTIPGHAYRIRFAYRVGVASCCGPGSVRVLWDEKELGVSYELTGQGFWHWSDYLATASNTITRVTWTNLQVSLEMDAFSVIDLMAPPLITRQPASLTTLAGGTAVFTVESLGTRPLRYEWRQNGSPIVAANGPMLILQAVNSMAAGDYTVTITNASGAVTSVVASLVVETHTNATILLQPYGDTVPAGSYFNFNVAAAGLAPLRYQWFFNGTALAGATNRFLTFTNVSLTNAGRYEAVVQNDLSSVVSLPAVLVVTNPANGGVRITFYNRILGTVMAPIFDADGVTGLAGPAYSAQLYAGATLGGLRAASVPTPFRTNASAAGYFTVLEVVLPNIAYGQDVLLQVRAWENALGNSYEEARARGGKFGKSQVLLIHLPPPSPPPVSQPLRGLTSFSLQAGLPQFTAGIIRLADYDPGNSVIWSLEGSLGAVYLIEKLVQPDDPVWRPYSVITNVTGTATFSDIASTNAQVILYRSRIVD